MTNIPQELIKKAVDTWGLHSQALMALEEMAELQKEILKNINRRKDNVAEIIDEVADVEIILAQLKYMYHIEEAVAERIPLKLEKMQRRLEGK